MKCTIVILSLVLAVVVRGTAYAEDVKKAPFSGPQKGEQLPELKVAGVYDDLAGKELDFVTTAAGKPLLLVFVHKLTRPSMLLTRIVTEYCKEREKDGVEARVVWLDKDRSKAEEYLTRARKSLRLRVPVGISVDGEEGPGAYGLNRNVTLTILVAKKNRVTANFAIVQPSDRDAPGILAEVVKLVGGKAPTLADLEKYRPRRGKMKGKKGRGAQDPRLAQLLRGMIRKGTTSEVSKEKATELEKYIADKPRLQRELGDICRRVVGGKIFREGGYGNETARAQIKKWAEKYEK